MTKISEMTQLLLNQITDGIGKTFRRRCPYDIISVDSASSREIFFTAGADSKYTDILTSQEADFFCCIGNSVFSAIIIYRL